MRRSPSRKARTHRIRPIGRIALTAVSGLAAGSMVLASSYSALAQAPEDTLPPDTHSAEPPTEVAPPPDTHTAQPPPDTHSAEPPTEVAPPPDTHTAQPPPDTHSAEPPTEVAPPPDTHTAQPPPDTHTAQPPPDTHTAQPPVTETPTPVPPSVPPPSVPQQPSVPSTTTTITVVPGDTLWGIAQKTLGSGALWTSIYDTNKSTIENAAHTYRHRTSRHGGLIFPGTRVKRPARKGLYDYLTPDQKAVVNCAIDLTLLARTKGLSKFAKPVIQKVLGTALSCDQIPASDDSFVGILRKAVSQNPALQSVLDPSLLSFDAEQCRTAILNVRKVVTAKGKVEQFEAAKDLLSNCLEKGKELQTALDKAGFR